MRVSKFYSALLIAFLAVGFVACGDTVSSTDASKNDGLDAVPGYHSGKVYSSNAKGASSSSQAPSSSAGSSATEEESSSSIDFSESNIQVDESGIAVITDEYLDADVSASVVSELDELKAKLDDNEEVSGFTENSKMRFSVDDLDYSKQEYFCYTEADEWFGITKEKLLETKLPFLWDGVAYDARAGFSLDFASICLSIYIKDK